MEVYIDNMLVKSAKETNHSADLEEAFTNLHRHQIKLNPRKCMFGVIAGKFLGFMITKCGIEVNPKKIHVILGMRHPIFKKEVQ